MRLSTSISSCSLTHTGETTVRARQAPVGSVVSTTSLPSSFAGVGNAGSCNRPAPRDSVGAGLFLSRRQDVFTSPPPVEQSAVPVDSLPAVPGLQTSLMRSPDKKSANSDILARPIGRGDERQPNSLLRPLSLCRFRESRAP